MSTNEKKRSRNEKRKSKQFKGVRMRNWGRWVSEIRVPKSETRIWLGSYDTAEKAARAYDAAVYCLHGPEGCRFNFAVSDLNFTEEERLALTIDQVKAIASLHALGKTHDRSLWAPLMTISSPALESSMSAVEPSNASSSTFDVHPSPVDWDANLSLDLLLQDGDLMKETIVWDLF